MKNSKIVCKLHDMDKTWKILALLAILAAFRESFFVQNVQIFLQNRIKVQTHFYGCRIF